MVDGLSLSLLIAAAGIALTHTVLGPDHYLPFILLARSRGWSGLKVALVTGVCGLGHVASSLVLGGLGVLLGVAVGRIEAVESGRGNLAAVLLVAFGLAYALWGTRKALRRARGIEPHVHAGHVHVHASGDRPHHHHHSGHRSRWSGVTFWSILTIFVLGPCEPLIPLFVLPASRGRWDLALITAVVFGVVTIGAMVGLTVLGALGFERIDLGPLARWDHAMAGGIIACSGLAILFLGL